MPSARAGPLDRAGIGGSGAQWSSTGGSGRPGPLAKVAGGAAGDGGADPPASGGWQVVLGKLIEQMRGRAGIVVWRDYCSNNGGGGGGGRG